MAVYYKDQAGQLWEYDTPEEAERQGLLPASAEDIRAHNHAIDVAEAGEGTTMQALGEGAQRVVGGVAEGVQNLTGLGTAPGLEEEPGGGLSALQEAYSPEARLRREAHPIAAGIGTGLAAAPASALAALGGAAALPAAAPLVGGAIGGIAAESAVQAVAQEYDDAWFEDGRQMQAQNVAAYTLMFGAGDWLFRGAVKGGARLLFGAPAGSAGLGRNLVSEAQGAARELSPELAPAGGGGSVGAARAADLSEPFDDAIRHMSDKDAAVLARDAEDHLHLIGQNASEAFTRVNQGLTDSLGSQLKYEDFATNAQSWDTRLLERQAQWLDSVVEQGDAVAREVAAFAEGNKGAIDFGNLGKKAAKLIDGFNQRLYQETDPARRNWLADNLKKQLDSVTLSIDASFGVDDVTRTDLKNLLAPYREGLRKGLENPQYWGENGALQRALNGPWHRFLEHWPKVQKEVLEATGHVAFDQLGAGRIARESTVDRMLAVLGRDPRSNQEFGRHLAGALDGLQELIEARQARGIAGTEGLEALAADVRSLAEDWNLATTVGVAKNRVGVMKRDPRKWATLALDLGQRLPIVGSPIQVARNLGAALTDLHLEQGTSLDAVWSRAYSRYAKNPAFADPSIARNYADWGIEALGQRGGPMPPQGAASAPPLVPGGSIFGAPVKAAASPAAGEALATVPASLRRRVGAGGVRSAEDARKVLLGGHGGKDLGVGGGPGVGVAGAVAPAAPVSGEVGLGAVVPEQAFEPVGARDVLVSGSEGAAGRISASAQEAVGRVTEATSDVFTPHVGSLAEGGIFYERLGTQKGKTPGGFFKGADGVVRYIKADKDAAHSFVEAGNSKMYAALGRPAVEWQTVQLPSGETALASVKLEGFRPLADVPDWGSLPPSVRDSYAEGVPADFIMGNWDVSRNAGNVLTDGRTTVMMDAGEAGANAWVTRWFKGNTAQAEQEIRRSLAYGHGAGAVAQPVGTPPHELLRSYAQSEGELRALMTRSFERAVSAIEQAGGVEAFIRAHQPAMPEPAVQRAAAEMTERIAKFRGALPFFAAAVYLAFGGTAQAAERPPPPATTPEHAYRDAMREIDKAGEQQLAALASDVLRKRQLKPGKKGPLELFAGRGSLESAVEATRQRLGELTGDPTALVRALAGSVGELSKTHPSVYTALVQKAHQIASYLQASWPPPSAPTLLQPQGEKLSFDRSWDAAARFIGATQPELALREVVRGTAPPEMIDAVQQNWGPELWEPFRAHLVGQVQRLTAAGRHIPSERLLRLDRMLGLDGQLDPSASQAVAMHFLAAQETEQAKRQQAGQVSGGRALSSGASMRTTLDAINSERQMQ